MGQWGIFNRMRKMKKHKKLTLVVAVIFLTLLSLSVSSPTVVYANPHKDTQITNEKEDTTALPVHPERLENTVITIPEKKIPAVKPVDLSAAYDYDKLYYSYRKSLAVFTGALIELNDQRDGEEYDDILGAVLGISYLLPSDYSPHWEAEAVFAYLEEGHLSVMQRFTKNEKSALRWFYRYGVLVKIESEEQLASIANWENFLIRGGIGLESMSTRPGSHRYTLDIAAGTELTYLMFTYGYSWGW
jgi:hypothetical protein